MKWVLIPLIALAGCDLPNATTTKADDAKSVYASEHPAGRFQMLAAGKDGEDVFLLDTTNGTMRRCWFQIKDQLKITCGDPTPPQS